MKNKICLIIIYLFSINITHADTALQHETNDISGLAALLIDKINTNAGVKSAEAALAAAKAAEIADGQALYKPELDIDLEKAVDTTASIGLSQTIDWNNKRDVRTSIAAQQRLAAEAQLHYVRQQLAIELLDVVVNYDIAKRLSFLAGERKKIMREFVALSRKRYAAGDLNDVSLKLSQLSLAKTQLEHSTARLSLLDKHQTLLSLLPNKDLSSIKLTATPPNADIEHVDIEKTVNNLVTTRKQAALIAKARQGVKLRSLETKPDPTVAVRIGQEESDLLAGINISIPLYIRHNFSAEVDVANAELLALELSAQDTYQRASTRLLSSLERYRLTHQTWHDWLNIGVFDLDEHISTLGKLWRAGEMTTSDYLAQLKQLLDARAAGEELRGRLWQTWFAWLAASGQIESWLMLLSQNKE